MPTRTVTIDGTSWRVMPSGFVTQYEHDEFGVLFVAGIGDARQVRVTRYSPTAARTRGVSLSELTDAELVQLFEYSQPSATSPEAGYVS
ncbi:MAG: hypothetical protein U0132_21125 [Gemmatimonadaceae bacterium]